MIRSVYIPLIDEKGGALAEGFAIGQALGANVEAMHISHDPSDAVALVGDGMTAPMIEAVVEAARREAAERARHAQRAFHDLCRQYGQTPVGPGTVHEGFAVSFEAVEGDGAQIVAERGRLHDLILVSRPGEEDEEKSLILDTALRDTGRPVLLSVGEEASSVPAHAVLAWNGSVEAARALAFALPVLRLAEAVTILSVEEEGREGPDGEAVATYLQRHGIGALRRDLAAEPRQTGAVLLDAVADVGGDLLVMGAYSRSRLRRLIFGAVTGEVIARSPIPVFLVH